MLSFIFNASIEITSKSDECINLCIPFKLNMKVSNLIRNTLDLPMADIYSPKFSLHSISHFPVNWAMLITMLNRQTGRDWRCEAEVGAFYIQAASNQWIMGKPVHCPRIVLRKTLGCVNWIPHLHFNKLRLMLPSTPSINGGTPSIHS